MAINDKYGILNVNITTESVDQNDRFGKASKIRDTIPRISTNTIVNE